MQATGIWLGAWLLAAVITAALGSVVQTQFNMNAIVALGVPVSPLERLAATGADLLHFAPVWLVLVGVALLIALPVASLMGRRLPARRRLLFVLAGGSGVLVLILTLNTLAPMTIIAATRSPIGTLGMALPGLAGGWLFAVLWRGRAANGRGVSR